MNRIEQFSSDIDWDSLIVLAAYGLLVLFYLIVLKLLMKCIEEMTHKSPKTYNTVIDADIRREAANKHADDKNFMFDSYAFALAFIKIVGTIGAIVGIYVIIMIKLNVFVATATAIAVGILVWQFRRWSSRGGMDKIKRSEVEFARMGGYNAGTLLILVTVFLFITAGLIFLPV